MVGVALTIFACGTAPVPDDDDIALPVRRPESDAEAGAGFDGAGLFGDDGDIVDVDPDASFVATQDALLCGATGLVMCFTFEGGVVDKSPNSFAPDVQDVTFVAGHLGQAASFGATSYVRFAPAASLDVTTGTIEAWASTNAGGVIFDDDNRMSLTILADGTVQCIPDSAVPVAKIPFGTWVHVACVFDGATTHIYVNGKEVDSGPSALIPSSPTSTAALGGNAPSGEPFLGALDSVRVFSVARSAAEIAAAGGVGK